MSDPGFDDDPAELTPFEYALAGVASAGEAGHTGFRLVEDMRTLLDEVGDAPIALAGLREFLDAGSANGSKEFAPPPLLTTSGRSLRKAGATGTFIDITPSDLTGNATPARRGVPAPTTSPAPPTNADAPTATPEQEPQRGQQVEKDEPIEADPTMDEVDTVHASLQQILAGPADDTGGHETGGSEAGGDEADAGQATADQAPSATEPEGPGTDTLAAAVDTSRLRGPGGRFSLLVGDRGYSVDGADGTRDDEDREDGINTEELVATGPIAGGAILAHGLAHDGARGGEDDPTVAQPVTLGLASAAPPLTAPTRLGETGGPAAGGKLGTVLALVGTAAAAVLVIGGVWWATTSDRIGAEEVAGDSIPASSTSPTRSGFETGTDTEDGAGPSGAAEPGRAGDGPTGFAPSSTTIEVELPASPTTRPPVATSAATRPPTSAAPTATATIQRSTTGPERSTTVATTAATRPASTVAPVTRPPITTAPPPTKAPQPASIGDRVTVGGSNGPGLGGVSVELWLDENRDGRGDRLLARTTTSDDGRYRFDIDAGCYEARFTAPSGHQISPELSSQRVCVEPGESATGIDAIAVVPVAGPSGCAIDTSPPSWSQGVHVVENSRDWADSYVFYDRSGSVVTTVSPGRGDYRHSPTDREWFGEANRFDEGAVQSVAAVRGGRTSAALSCSR